MGKLKGGYAGGFVVYPWLTQIDFIYLQRRLVFKVVKMIRPMIGRKEKNDASSRDREALLLGIYDAIRLELCRPGVKPDAC